MPSEPKTATKLTVNLASRSRMRNLNCATRFASSMSRLRACWTSHAPVGLAVTPQNVDPATRDLHHEQHVQALEEHRVDVEAAARQHGFGLRQQELPPGQPHAARCWLDARSFEQQPHGARRDRVPKPAEFTVDAPIAHVGFSRDIRRIRRRSSGSVEGRPGRRWGLVQWRLTRSRCQRSNVSGATTRWRRRCLGSSRVSAASTARSGQAGHGRATCRGSTATSCRARGSRRSWTSGCG